LFGLQFARFVGHAAIGSLPSFSLVACRHHHDL
jgi:hypothetical protein